MSSELEKRKEKIIEASGIPTGMIPRVFPLQQELGETRAGYITRGAIAGGLTSIAVQSAAHMVGKKLHVPTTTAVGVAAGMLRNHLSYKEGTNERRHDKAKEKIAKKTN